MRQRLDQLVLPPGGETLKLSSLVDHRESVPAHMAVADVFQTFEQHHQEYVAVLEGEQLLGLCSRGQIGYLLGARFGFAINSHHPIREHLLPQHVATRYDTPVMTVLEQVLSRTGEQFYDDVALVDEANRFLGIISMQTLVRLQSRLLLEKIHLSEEQQRDLEIKNQELFRSLNQLRQSQGRCDILFENSALGVALVNGRGEIETANKKLKLLLGNAARWETAPLPKLGQFILPAEQNALAQLLAKQEENHEDAGRVFTFNLPEQGRRRFKLLCSRICETGQICVWLEDITEQELLEREAAQREKSALLDSLVGGIAHELNNRLTPIAGYAELLRTELEEAAGWERAAGFCRTICDNALESAKIIRQLLQLSRPLTRELSWCNLHTLVQEALTLLKFRFRQANLWPEVRLPETPLEFLADSSQIKQVLVNLLLNALDALEGASTRRLILTAAASQQRVHLSLADTGHGIRPEHLKRIFDPFFTTKGPQRGTGLGLSVCQSIVREHAGEIMVESIPGQGTTFRVALPAGEKLGAAPPAPGVAAPAPAARPGREPRVRVLVVDDEQFITGLLQEMLRTRLGFSVEWAYTGEHAIERLKEGGFSLVISDVRMPGIDGVQLFEWVRVHLPQLTSHFIFITGDAGGSGLSEKVQSLKVPVLRKPFSLNALADHCESLLRA